MRVWNAVVKNIKQIFFEKEEPFFLFEHCKLCKHSRIKQGWGGNPPGLNREDTYECIFSGRKVSERNHEKMDCKHFKEG